MWRLRVLKNNSRVLDEDWAKEWVAGGSVLVQNCWRLKTGRGLEMMMWGWRSCENAINEANDRGDDSDEFN